jgi:predicted aspartyl protease
VILLVQMEVLEEVEVPLFGSAKVKLAAAVVIREAVLDATIMEMSEAVAVVEVSLPARFILLALLRVEMSVQEKLSLYISEIRVLICIRD